MFSGSMVAIVTPMTADGGLDWPAWDRLLDFHLREGTDGIVVAGTTGESPVLLMEEIEELTRRAVAHCRGRLKVIVGAGTYSTAGTVARHPRIVAIKEATGSLSRARETLNACPPEFVLLSGDDATAIDWMSMGARGVISVTANVAARRMHEACEAALAGDFVKARAIDASLQPLHKDLF